MANWKKVIVSGSQAQLNQLSVDTSVNVTGSLSAASTVKLTGLSNTSQATIVGIDAATGQLYYQGTGSFTANSASYATTASFAQSGNGVFSGSFSGSFQGNGAGLTDIPASGIVGLQLNQIASGSATASISPDNGFQVNVPTSINGAVAVTGSITVGNVLSTGANSKLTGSFSGSFTGVASLPPLTQGRGITAFSYDGSGPDSIEISGSVGLSSNTVTKWTGDAFANSSITDGVNVTINNAGGVYIQAGGLDVSGSSVFHNNVIMQGNLTVNGTASFQNTTNLEVADQFILLNSGSSTFQDSGIVINTGNTGNSGSAWYLETSGTTTGAPQNGRFAVASGVAPNATTATPGEYAVTAVISGSIPGASVPQWGGTGLGHGNMWVDSGTGDIYIYS